MNSIIENIKSRRSVRSYLDEEVPKDLIEEIVEAGRYAPSALNKQPWEFIIITNKGLIRELSGVIREITKRILIMAPILRWFNRQLRDESTISAIRKTATSREDTVFYDAPVIIFIVSNQLDPWVEINCALAAQNMMLAAHSLGLGSCFIGRAILLSKDKRSSKKLGLKKGYKIYAALIFGYPREFPKKFPSRRKDNLICWKE